MSSMEEWLAASKKAENDLMRERKPITEVMDSVKNTSEDKKYTYETKCRVCGKITSWYVSPVIGNEYAYFKAAMDQKILYPTSGGCQTCKKTTVQDVVSFSDEEGN